jgi:hypothetical protein
MMLIKWTAAAAAAVRAKLLQLEPDVIRHGCQPTKEAWVAFVLPQTSNYCHRYGHRLQSIHPLHGETRRGFDKRAAGVPHPTPTTLSLTCLGAASTRTHFC